MRMKKLRQIIAACMTGCVLLAGCGSTATEDTQQSSKLPQLVIGSDSYEPFNYINEDGEFAGVDVELAQEACRRIGYEPVFTQIVWEDKDEYLEEGSVDCLWGSFTMTGREEEYTWVGPYLNSRQVVVVHAPLPLQILFLLFLFFYSCFLVLSFDTFTSYIYMNIPKMLFFFCLYEILIGSWIMFTSAAITITVNTIHHIALFIDILSEISI